jgi:hypothetical protein
MRRYEEMHDGIKLVCIFTAYVWSDKLGIDMFAIKDGNCVPISSVCHAPAILAFECRAMRAVAPELKKK